MPPLQLPIGKGKGGQSGDSPIADAAGVSIPQKEDYARGVNEQHEERQDWPKELRWEIPWELLHSHALACQPLLREVDSWRLVRVDRIAWLGYNLPIVLIRGGRVRWTHRSPIRSATSEIATV